MLAVLDNPSVDILGHPFGISRSRFKKDPSEDQFRIVIEKAAARRIAFEINSQYHSNPRELARWCHEAGALVSLGSNAHRACEVGDIVRVLDGQNAVSWSEKTARREGGIP
jgi:histidinol phosphatase-like PHP family hydrolase